MPVFWALQRIPNGGRIAGIAKQWSNPYIIPLISAMIQNHTVKLKCSSERVKESDSPGALWI